MAPKKVEINYNDGEVDLSMSELKDVPVKDILSLKRVYSLDLSNNSLVALPKTFSSLTTLTFLDLSKNELKELPEDFGNLVKLNHLDLYRNQIQHLPLSFSKLKNLRWLDLKDNPLVPAVSKVAGLCIDTKGCQNCAKNIVEFYTKLELKVAAELEMRNRDRQRQLEINQKKKQEEKKEKKKQKKKEKKSVLETVQQKTIIEPTSNNIKTKKNQMKKNKSFISKFLKLFFFILSIYILLVFVKVKDSGDVYTKAQEFIIEDFKEVVIFSQEWWKVIKNYVLTLYKKYIEIYL